MTTDRVVVVVGMDVVGDLRRTAVAEANAVAGIRVAVATTVTETAGIRGVLRAVIHVV